MGVGYVYKNEKYTEKDFSYYALRQYFKCFIFISSLFWLKLSAQNKNDSIFNFQIDKIAIPVVNPYSGINLILKSIYQDSNTYVLVCSQGDNNQSHLIKVYNSTLEQISVNNFLSEKYIVKDFIKCKNKYIFCGLYSTDYRDTIGSDESYHKEYLGFVAELSEKFEVINIEVLKGIHPYKIINHHNEYYFTGKMANQGVTINNKKVKSYSLNQKIIYDELTLNYPDIVLCKLDANFDILNIAHFAVEGSFDVGGSIAVNSNNFVSFTIKTWICDGPDHGDGNLYMVDSNFKMLFHMQYTDNYLGSCFATIVNFNDKNELLCNVKSYYALKTTEDSVLYTRNETVLKNNIMEFQGLITYNSKGNILTQQKTDIEFADSFGHPRDIIPFKIKENENLNYIKLFNEGIYKNNVRLSYYIIGNDGKLYCQNYIPKGVPPLLLCHYNYEPNSNRQELITIKQ